MNARLFKINNYIKKKVRVVAYAYGKKNPTKEHLKSLLRPVLVIQTANYIALTRNKLSERLRGRA